LISDVRGFCPSSLFKTKLCSHQTATLEKKSQELPKRYPWGEFGSPYIDQNYFSYSFLKKYYSM